MEILGIGKHFEDLPVGTVFRTISRTISEPDLVNYINCLGLLEVMFTNQEFQREEADIRGRLVPGMLAHGFAEGLLAQAVMQHTAFAFLEMDLKVVSPARVGDTIHVEVEVIEARRSKSRPNRGLIRTKNTVKKQDGTVLLVYTPLRMVKCSSIQQ